jgi:hypothetical protein
MNLTFKDVPKAILYILCCASTVVLAITFSWITMVIYGLLIFSMLVWSMSMKLRWRTCQRVFKYVLIGMMLSTVIFAASKAYMFRTAGYPPTFDPSQPNIIVSRSTILDTSMVELVQGIKNTPASNLLSIEYPENVLRGIELHTWSYGIDGGHVIVQFHHSSALATIFSFESYLGRPYQVTARPSSLVLPVYAQQQTADEALQQIDDLGLQWFYDRTVEEYQNKHGSTPEITAINVDIKWSDYETYQGLTLNMSCLYEGAESRPSSFASVFQPNGTIL